MRKKYLVIGLPFSSNLGDRLINDSINYLFSTKDIDIINFDLIESKIWNENERFTLVHDKKSLIDDKKSLFNKFKPDFLRGFKSLMIHKKNMESDQLRRLVQEADKIIIGGGNLLIDNYLSFPSAIYFIYLEAKKQNKEIHLFCVGASGRWSLTAKFMFRNILKYAKSVSTRDTKSKEFITKLYPNLIDKVFILSDPAIFTENLSGDICLSDEKEKEIVGIGIMSPIEVIRRTKGTLDQQFIINWWIQLINYYLEMDYEVKIFSNGGNRDNNFIEKFIKLNQSKFVKNSYEFCQYPRDTGEFLEILNSCNVIIAQRLHACLPAISMNKITIGVKWDPKVEATFTNMDIKGNLIDFNIEKNNLISILENAKAVEKDQLEIKKLNIKKFVDNYIL